MSMVFIAITAAILEVTAVNYARIGTATFDLSLIVLVYFSLKKGFRTGMMLGALFGVLNGFFSAASVWWSVFLYSLAGFLVGYIGQWFYKENLLTFILMVTCAMFFIYFVHYVTRFIAFPIQVSILDYSIRLFIPQVAYTIVASIFSFYFLREL